MNFNVRVGHQHFYVDPTELSSEEREVIARDGIFLFPDGTPMEDLAQRRLRAVFARDDALRGLSERYFNEVSIGIAFGSEWVIPGLWRTGTIPMLTGQPKSGKTTLGRELLRALVIPGTSFLDRFEPTDLPMEAHIWYINAETPVTDFEDALVDGGLYEGEEGIDRRHLHIEHLEGMGGPGLFDLTSTANFDQWATHLQECIDCGETGEMTVPDVLIVDGLTAILGGDTDRYGQWYPHFRELHRYLDIPNGLVIAHSTLRGTHAMGGTEALAGPDGLWTYSASDKGRRLFSVAPRMGGRRIEPTRVDEGEDGRLRAATPAEPRHRTERAAHAKPSPDAAILDYLATSGTLPTTREVLAAVPGRETRAALDRLIASGRLVVEPRQGRGGGYLYRLGQEPAGEETKASK